MAEPKQQIAVALGALFFLVMAAEPAQAYLDAGSTSLIFQALIGGVAAALVLTKAYWQRIKTFFGRGERNPERAPDARRPGD